MKRSHAQFGLGNLLGLVLFAAVLFASIRFGLAPCISLGVSVGLLGWRLLSHGPRAPWGTVAAGTPRRRLISAIAGLCILAALLPGLGWWPNSTATYMLTLGPVAWLVLLWSLDLRGLRKVAILAPFCAAAYPPFVCLVGHEEMPWIMSISAYYYVDCRTDRHRVVGWPGIDFCKNGPNHALLKAYLPASDDEWLLSAMLSSDRQLDSDRVSTRCVLLRPHLSRILCMLPSEEARAVVVRALADRGNLARVHQGLLLTWFATKGRDDTEPLEDWWQHSALKFDSVRDPNCAAQLVAGWRERISRQASLVRGQLSANMQYELKIQLQAASWQELGTRGGDERFARALSTFRKRKARGVKE